MISLYANEKKLPIPNPKKIKNNDVVFSLLSHNDEITIGLVKFISNFFGVPDHDDYNPLSEKYGPSINFCFNETFLFMLSINKLVCLAFGVSIVSVVNVVPFTNESPKERTVDVINSEPILTLVKFT